MERRYGLLFLITLMVVASPGGVRATEPAGGDGPDAAATLTAEERAWLAAHPVIRLALSPDYAPVEFLDEKGRYRGITADYVALIERRLGMRFEIVRLRPNELVRAYADVGALSAPTPERLKTWRYSSLYLEFPAYIIVRSSVTQPLTLAELAGARVAVVDGYAAQDYLSALQPALVLDRVPDTRTGLRKVAFGLVDAFVSDLPVATYWMEKEGITNLKIAGESGYVYRMGFASRRDWPELGQILEKGLALVSPAEREEIFRRWVSLPPPPLASRRYVIALAAALAAAGFAVAVVLLWNRFLSSQVARRTLELARERDRLRVSEERLRLALEAARMGTWEWNIEQDAMTWAKGAEAILGLREGQLAAHGQGYLGLVHPEDWPTVQHLVAEALSGAREDFQVLHRFLNPAGELRWLEVHGRVYRDQAGHPVYLRGTVADATNRKQAEERLQRGEKLAAMGALIAGVAHEVRTPLFSITASLDAFETEVGPRESETITLLRSQAARLAHLMGDLLDYGSPPALCRVRGGVADPLRHAARTCATLAREAGVGIEVIVGDDMLSVSRDSARLEQVFQNLLANAVQHAPRGSTVRTTIRAAEGSRSGVEVRFEDAGPGLPLENIARVFQPFFSRRRGGTGLGLSIVQRIVEDHDGTVTADNGPQGGAVFTVFLPSAEPSGVEAGAGHR